MRVAIYTDSIALGGAETALRNLVGELRPDLDVTVIGVTPEVVREVASARPRARAEVLPPIRNKADARAIRAHLRVLRRLRPDVLHVNLPEPWSSRYAIWAGLVTPGVNVVAVEQLPLPVNGRWRRFVKRLGNSRLAAHVAVGERAAREVERHAGLPAGSVETVFNGVPDRELEPPPRPLPGPIVGAHGRLHEQKGYDLLLDAMASLDRDASAVLVGDGPARATLERQVERLGLADRVQLRGWSDDARRYLTTFDVFALPSRYEGFPLALVEAMLAGLPVVAAAVGSVPEAIVDGETGVLVPPDDAAALAAALRRLLDDEPLRRRMGERARARALERFTAAAMARAYESLYARILS